MNSSKRILMVDDDPTQLELYEEVLSLDYHVFVAHSVAEALKLLANEQVDAVGCDYNLNDGSGLQVIEWIEIHRPELLASTVLITGDLNPSIKRLGVSLLHKPVPIDALLDVFDAWLVAKDEAVWENQTCHIR